MEIENFCAERFRNLVEVEAKFSSGMNVFYGENAQGKTNLLEGIYFLSSLRSFRTRNLSELLQFGESTALLQGVILVDQGKHHLAVQLDRNQKLPVLDRKKIDPFRYLGVFHVFLFSFPLLEVIRGGPEDRRRFLDRSVSVSRPGYLVELMQYHRALKQKNALLSQILHGMLSPKVGIPGVQAFNQQLLKHGLEITQQRVVYLNRLQELVGEKQLLFFDKDLELRMELRSSFLTSAEEVERKLEEALERELERGMSLIGIHRDDVWMSINGRELRKFGSSGQHRAFLLLLLLAQMELYESWRREKPVLLLDDLDSELDQKKIQSFLNEIQRRYQTLISTSRKELFFLDSGSRMFEISAGRLLEMG